MKISKILTGIGLLLLTACSDDDKTVVEQITGPTEVNLISCDVLVDKNSQTGDLAWKQRREAILAMVAEQKPDILCMQGQLWNQVIYLEQQLPAYQSVDYNVDGNDANTGRHNTIMFRTDKYTLIKNGRYWLSQKPTTMSYPWASNDAERRCTAWVLLKDNATNARFYVGCTLMNDGDDQVDMAARTNSAKLNVDKFKEFMIADDTDIPVIIAGNMNASADPADPRHECLDPYYDWMTNVRESAPATDSRPSYNGLGNPAAGKSLTPDHVFIYKASALSFSTIEKNYGVPYLSDHNPISCKIKF